MEVDTRQNSWAEVLYRKLCSNVFPRIDSHRLFATVVDDMLALGIASTRTTVLMAEKACIVSDSYRTFDEDEKKIFLFTESIFIWRQSEKKEIKLHFPQTVRLQTFGPDWVSYRTDYSGWEEVIMICCKYSKEGSTVK